MTNITTSDFSCSDAELIYNECLAQENVTQSADSNDKYPDTIPDEILLFVLAGLVAILSIVTILVVMHAKGKIFENCGHIGCHRTDSTRPERAWIFALQVWDLFTDGYFVYILVS